MSIYPRCLLRFLVVQLVLIHHKGLFLRNSRRAIMGRPAVFRLQELFVKKYFIIKDLRTLPFYTGHNEMWNMWGPWGENQWTSGKCLLYENTQSRQKLLITTGIHEPVSFEEERRDCVPEKEEVIVPCLSLLFPVPSLESHCFSIMDSWIDSYDTTRFCNLLWGARRSKHKMNKNKSNRIGRVTKHRNITFERTRRYIL